MIRAILPLLPFITGAYFLKIHFTSRLAPLHLTSFAHFFITFLAWHVVRYIVAREQRLGSKEIRTKRAFSERAVSTFFLLTFSLLFLISLQSFKETFLNLGFYILLGILPMSALADRLTTQRNPTLRAILTLLSITGIAFISFLPLGVETWWQPLTISFGIGSIHAALTLPTALNKLRTEMEEHKEAKRASLPEGRLFRKVSRLFIILLLLGPLSILGLVYLGQEPEGYLWSMVSILAAYPLLLAFRDADRGNLTLLTNQDIQRESSLYVLLHHLILFALALWYVY